MKILLGEISEDEVQKFAEQLPNISRRLCRKIRNVVNSYFFDSIFTFPQAQVEETGRDVTLDDPMIILILKGKFKLPNMSIDPGDVIIISSRSEICIEKDSLWISANIYDWESLPEDAIIPESSDL
jgi:hypothetical protein